jgi:hypothetical protein
MEIFTAEFINNIARICHEANRAYCVTINDHSQQPWCKAPEWQKDSARKGVKLHLNELYDGNIPLPSKSHESWLAEKLNSGWTYGDTKDETKKTHPCCVPYDNLPNEQKVKDYLFISIVTAMYKGRQNAK